MYRKGLDCGLSSFPFQTFLTMVYSTYY